MNFNPAPFQSWLINRNYSTSTVKNYLSDINNYLSFIKNRHQTIQIKEIFNQQTISSYLTTITDKSSYKRYLASLNKFCQFALDQQIISTNPVKKLLKISQAKYKQDLPTNTKDISDQFALFLKQQNKSNSTIKNYLVDINQFLSWASHES